LTMRVPVRDVMKLLTDKEIARSITNILGKNSYRMLLNQVMDMTNSPGATNIGFWAETFRQIDKAMGTVQGAFAATVLVLNPTTIAVQPVSVLTTALNKMGPTGAKHLAKAV